MLSPPVPREQTCIGMNAKVFGSRLSLLIDVIAAVTDEGPGHPELHHGSPVAVTAAFTKPARRVLRFVGQFAKGKASPPLL